MIDSVRSTGSASPSGFDSRPERRVRELKVREVVPRTEFPNFRDHGLNVESPLLHLLENLQRRHGETFAAESGLRRMLAEDVLCPECGVSHPRGHMPGVDTIAQALERFELRGLITQDWLLAGGVMPDGDQCRKGIRLIRVAANRQQRFAFAARARTRNRREGITRRVEPRAVSLEQARANVGRMVPPAPDTRQQDAERKRREDLERLRELEARGFFATPGEKPPD